jgi:6-pyruvoyltetrahydropterin/6-carboxytetrahydropterin synthase
VDLIVDFRFSAAHRLPRYVGRCHRMHGHSYRLEVVVSGTPAGDTGMIVDFHSVEAAVAPVLADADGSCFNDVLDNPTAEAIVVWFWRRLEPNLSALRELRLWETSDCRVVYRGEPVPEQLLSAGRPQTHPSTAAPA